MEKQLHRALRLGALLSCLGIALCSTRHVADAQQPYELNVSAPELVGGSWLNTPRSQPIKLASRRGKVTIVEFWTFG